MSFQTTAALTVFAAVGIAVGAVVVPSTLLGSGVRDSEYAAAVVLAIEAECDVTVSSSEVSPGRLVDPVRPEPLGAAGELVSAADGKAIAVSDVLVIKNTASFYTDYEPEPFCDVELPER